MNDESRLIIPHSTFRTRHFNGGQGGIRTHEALTPTRVPVVLLKPLGHLSKGKDEIGRMKDENYYPSSFLFHLAVHPDREGFEPPVLCSTTVFETAAFDHSAICPRSILLYLRRCVTDYSINKKYA